MKVIKRILFFLLKYLIYIIPLIIFVIGFFLTDFWKGLLHGFAIGVSTMGLIFVTLGKHLARKTIDKIDEKTDVMRQRL